VSRYQNASVDRSGRRVVDRIGDSPNRDIRVAYQEWYSDHGGRGFLWSLYEMTLVVSDRKDNLRPFKRSYRHSKGVTENDTCSISATQLSPRSKVTLSTTEVESRPSAVVSTRTDVVEENAPARTW
jgi:hypothetical protein